MAAVLAIGAHVVALLALGWRTPRAPTPPAGDDLPPIQLSLAPIRPEAPAASAPAAASPKPSRAGAASKIASAPGAPSPPAPSPPATALAAGPPDCEPEDLPLLTEAEKARCRNQIDADHARRQARGEDGRIAREVARAKTASRVDSIPAEKRAYYDAVAAAYDQQSHGPPMAGHTPGIGCSIKLDGLKMVKAKPPPHSLSLGPCFLAPPQGFLTEESRIAPP